MANRYLNISSRAELYLLRHQDRSNSINELWERITELQAEYHQVNEDAEAFPTNTADLRQARRKTSLVPFASPAPGRRQPGHRGGLTPTAGRGVDRARRGRRARNRPVSDRPRGRGRC